MYTRIGYIHDICIMFMSVLTLNRPWSHSILREKRKAVRTFFKKSYFVLYREAYSSWTTRGWVNYDNLLADKTQWNSGCESSKSAQVHPAEGDSAPQISANDPAAWRIVIYQTLTTHKHYWDQTNGSCHCALVCLYVSYSNYLRTKKHPCITHTGALKAQTWDRADGYYENVVSLRRNNLILLDN